MKQVSYYCCKLVVVQIVGKQSFLFLCVAVLCAEQNGDDFQIEVSNYSSSTNIDASRGSHGRGNNYYCVDEVEPIHRL